MLQGTLPSSSTKEIGEDIGSKGERTVFHCGGFKRMAPYAHIFESSVPSQSL